MAGETAKGGSSDVGLIAVGILAGVIIALFLPQCSERRLAIEHRVNTVAETNAAELERLLKAIRNASVAAPVGRPQSIVVVPPKPRVTYAHTRTPPVVYPPAYAYTPVHRHMEYVCAPCADGYWQDADTCDCHSAIWRPGPPPR